MNEGESRRVKAKWSERGGADVPSAVVGRRALRRRLKAVRRRLEAAIRPESDPEQVHQLRVATRRAAVVVGLLAPFLPSTPAKRLRAALKRIRRAAADARSADVLLEFFSERAEARRSANEPERAAACEPVLEALTKRRRAAQDGLEALVAEKWDRRTSRYGDLALAALAKPRPLRPGEARGDYYALGALAARCLPRLTAPLHGASVEELRDIGKLHGLRLSIKKLRYAIEVFCGALPTRLWMETQPRLESLQERLGAVTDADEAVEAMAAPADENGDATESAALAAELLAERESRHSEFLEWWPGPEAAALRAGLDELAERSQTPPPAPARPDGPVRHHRIAALDVGTNSVRLVVAETDPKRGFRVIEDVKESTRLGGGMFADSRLTPEAIDRTLAAVARLRGVAEGHRVESLRAIGTAALREARNRDEFLARAESEAGVRIEVVDTEREALLAFASIAGAMDLSRRRVAALDIGGGSAQVVVSAGGLVDGVHPIKLGAVRLAELFAHLANEPEEQYLAKRSAAMESIHDAIPPPAARLDALIGVGGTCNNLARLAVRNGAATVGGGRFLFAVSGSELPYSEVLRLLDWLRRLTPDERRTAAGLSPQRAEIIVAGAVIVERVMDRLGCERLQVHDGGVRDGLLAEMVDELGVLPPPAPRRPSDALVAARDYAERCSPDRPHGEHVARLSLHIFDQLAADTVDATGVWAAPEARVLLEIGALLHDCGALIAYKSHHRHGFDMLMRADLPTLTRREREIVALLARYHRKRGPEPDDPEFRHLSAGDQRLASHLAGILRIADGLDRTHDQRVSAVQVRARAGRVAIAAVADDEPEAGLRSAQRKSDVFSRAFRAEVEVVWAPVATPVGAGSEANA